MGYTPGTGPKGTDTFNATTQTVSDLQRLNDTIAKRGNLLVDTSTVRLALTGSSLYEGLFFYDTTDNLLYVYNGSGWVLASSLENSGSVTVTNFGTGFTPNATYPVRVNRDGMWASLSGLVDVGATANLSSAILTVDTQFRPLSNNRFIGHTRSSNTMEGMLHLEPSGVLTLPPLYRSGTIATGNFLPVAGHWPID